jgi:hypothetical protein
LFEQTCTWLVAGKHDIGAGCQRAIAGVQNFPRQPRQVPAFESEPQLQHFSAVLGDALSASPAIAQVSLKQPAVELLPEGY